jgi:opacity protein-like surface antigen
MQPSKICFSILSGAILLSSTAAFASGGVYIPPSNNCCKPLYDGLYVGGQVGFDFAFIKSNFAGVDDTVGDFLTDNHSKAVTGFIGGGFVGYGQTFNNLFYLGVEFFGNGANATDSANASITDSNSGDILGFSESVSIKGNYGISLLPGIKLNDSTLAYVRLGYHWGRVSVDESILFSDVMTGIPPTVIPFNFSSTRGGFNYGLGLETAIVRNFSIRGEVNHTDYRSFATNTGTNIKVLDNQAMVGLIYHFA